MEMYVHSAQAIKDGQEADRLYIVVGVDRDGICTAWSCKITAHGVVHPCAVKPLSARDISRGQGRLPHYPNGQEPTAHFKPDDQYELIDGRELAARITLSVYPEEKMVYLTEKFYTDESGVRQYRNVNTRKLMHIVAELSPLLGLDSEWSGVHGDNGHHCVRVFDSDGNLFAEIHNKE